MPGSIIAFASPNPWLVVNVAVASTSPYMWGGGQGCQASTHPLPSVQFSFHDVLSTSSTSSFNAMADPLSAAASVAGIISLADVLLRTTKELYTFFAAVKDASKNAGSILQELGQFDNILLSVKTNVDSYNSSPFSTNDGLSASVLLNHLKNCSAEFDVLKNIVEESKRKQGLGPLQKYTSKVKWVFDEKKIAQSCQRLEKEKLLLNTALSLAGRKDYSSPLKV